MGNILKDNIVLLLDNYGEDSQKLHNSFKLAGKNYPVFVIEEDGFLPEDVTSVFSYFLGDFKNAKNIPGKPLYFNRIKVPEYWEISGSNSIGSVHNLNKERAKIFYSEPKHKRLVKVVDWYDDRGVVRSSDHYNRYGALYARTIFNAKGQKVNKSHFSADGREIVMENYVTKDIILNDGNIVKIFKTKQDYIKYVLEKAGYTGCRIFYNTLSTSFFVSQSLPENGKGDVLFWQEPVSNEIPGNMTSILNGTSPRTAKVMVQRMDSYDKMLALGASAKVISLLGFIYPFKKENRGKKEALICTNSDNIAEINTLVEALPEVHFSIAALTEMSSKLMSLDKYSNVSLYPGVKMKVLDELFEEADFYLDINHESEIVSAVEKAFLHNHLIFAFKETLHNPRYVIKKNIFAKEQVKELILAIKSSIGNTDLLNEELEQQRAFAMLETKEKYSEI